MKRLLLDQGLPRSTVAILTQAHWDIVHVSEIGMSRAAGIEAGRAEGGDESCHGKVAGTALFSD